jgi:hypothetical protein
VTGPVPPVPLVKGPGEEGCFGRFAFAGCRGCWLQRCVNPCDGLARCDDHRLRCGEQRHVVVVLLPVSHLLGWAEFNLVRTRFAERRRGLTSQLERLRELYVMGDITKPQYVMRRQMMEEELQRTKPPTDPDLDRAQALLEDFARFWDAEPQPAERRKLILSLFAQVWANDGQIVAVKPNRAFARCFTAASEVRAKHPKSDADSEATIAGATGLEPAASGVTGRRSNQLSYAPVWIDAK